MKTILSYLIALLLTLSVSPADLNESERSFRHSADVALAFAADYPGAAYTLYPEDEVTINLLTTRTERDEYIVEVCTGTVLNETKDGKTDAPDPYNYISYRRLPFETKPGDRIITYLVFEIHSDGEDDIIARYDYPLN